MSLLVACLLLVDLHCSSAKPRKRPHEKSRGPKKDRSRLLPRPVPVDFSGQGERNVGELDGNVPGELEVTFLEALSRWKKEVERLETSLCSCYNCVVMSASQISAAMRVFNVLLPQ